MTSAGYSAYSAAAGSVLGGFVGRLLGMYGASEGAGFIMATLGAIALLSAYRMITRKHA